MISLPFAPACGGEDEPADLPLGIIVGRIQLDGDLRCRVNVEGTYLGGDCDADGLFKIIGVPAGKYTVRVSPQAPTLAPVLKSVTVEPGQNKDIGAIELLAPGRVAGFYTPSDGLDPTTSVVVIDDSIAAGRPSAGQYLVAGVNEGTHTVALLFSGSSVVQTNVPVNAMGETNTDFDLGLGEATQAQLAGSLVFVGGTPDVATVDLIRLPAQTVAATARPSVTGEFELIAAPGCYLLAAKSGDSAALAVKQIVLTAAAQKDVGTFALLETSKTISLATDDDGNNIPDGLEPPCAALD